MLDFAPTGQLMLYAESAGRKKFPVSRPAYALFAGQDSSNGTKTQESRYYKALRAIFVCCRPLTFVGTRTIPGATLGATLVLQNELPPNVTN